MVQQVLILSLFLLALFYLGRMAYRAFQPKKGCEGECKCSVNVAKQPLKN